MAGKINKVPQFVHDMSTERVEAIKEHVKIRMMRVDVGPWDLYEEFKECPPAEIFLAATYAGFIYALKNTI